MAKRVTDQIIDDAEKRIKEAYALRRKTILDISAEYRRRGIVTFADMQKKGVYDEFVKRVNTELGILNSQTTSIIRGSTKGAYSESFYQSIFNIGQQASPELLSSFNLIRPEVIERALANPLADFSLVRGNADLKASINQGLAQSLIKGESYENMASRLNNVMGSQVKNPMRVARTEGNRVVNVARMDAAHESEEYGLEISKEWIATLDDRTRDEHGAMDGEIVPLDERFSNGLLYPGDPAGGPEWSINCRCTFKEIIKQSQKSTQRRYDGKIQEYKTYSEWRKDKGL